MGRQKMLGSYLIRFFEEQSEHHIHLHNLKTGEVLEFETWVSAWCFLEEKLSDLSTPCLMPRTPRETFDKEVDTLA
jgi:hypothetical protein